MSGNLECRYQIPRSISKRVLQGLAKDWHDILLGGVNLRELIKLVKIEMFCQMFFGSEAWTAAKEGAKPKPLPGLDFKEWEEDRPERERIENEKDDRDRLDNSDVDVVELLNRYPWSSELGDILAGTTDLSLDELSMLTSMAQQFCHDTANSSQTPLRSRAEAHEYFHATDASRVEATQKQTSISTLCCLIWGKKNLQNCLTKVKADTLIVSDENANET